MSQGSCSFSNIFSFYLQYLDLSKLTLIISSPSWIFLSTYLAYKFIFFWYFWNYDPELELLVELFFYFVEPLSNIFPFRFIFPFSFDIYKSLEVNFLNFSLPVDALPKREGDLKYCNGFSEGELKFLIFESSFVNFYICLFNFFI